MIKQKTVFILGAGASAPFGFPTSSKLCSSIYQEFANESRTAFKRLQRMGFTAKEIQSFRNTLNDSGSMIDDFLNDRKEFQHIGKTAIATILLDCEKHGNLFGPNITNNWYRFLFERLTKEATFETFQANNLTIITFNYDRSLDYYLFIALNSRYGKTNEECYKKLKEIPIYHIYGKLGPLPWEVSSQQRAVKYGQVNDTSKIADAASFIKLIHEATSSVTTYDACVELTHTTRIIFLGFGYHPTNMEILHIKDYVRTKECLGTAYHLSKTTRDYVWNEFQTSDGHPAIELANNAIGVFNFLYDKVNLK